jgi:hypothetical protein
LQDIRETVRAKCRAANRAGMSEADFEIFVMGK